MNTMLRTWSVHEIRGKTFNSADSLQNIQKQANKNGKIRVKYMAVLNMIESKPFQLNEME